MTSSASSYVLVTPVKDEEANLGRLADSIRNQTLPPHAWVIVDTGSEDNTPELAGRLAERLPFVRTLSTEGPVVPERGGPVVRAFLAGIATLDNVPEVVIKTDADTSFGPDYCERLVGEFAADPQLGLASGTCNEFLQGQWQPVFGTRAHVWGASRAYRWTCLQAVLPLEERQGWDEIDGIKAQVLGWRVRTITHLDFYHHRTIGLREGSSTTRWAAQGSTAHYMGYRPSYLVARGLWRGSQDPAALAMIGAYLRAVIRREPQCPDPAVRLYLRREQSLRRMPLRLREARGQRT